MKPQKFTDDEAAFAAYQWACGRSQARIAHLFGVSVTAVCIAISEFIKKHSDARRRPGYRHLLLDDEMPRQKLAGIVAENYCKNRKGKLRLRVVARSYTLKPDARESRYEDTSGRAGQS